MLQNIMYSKINKNKKKRDPRGRDGASEREEGEGPRRGRSVKGAQAAVGQREGPRGGSEGSKGHGRGRVEERKSGRGSRGAHGCQTSSRTSSRQINIIQQYNTK